MMEERRSTDDRRTIRRSTLDRRTYLSIEAYARQWGVSRQTIYKWLDAELLEHYRFDGMVRIKNICPAHHQPTSTACSS